jgi:D-aspartate ligase
VPPSPDGAPAVPVVVLGIGPTALGVVRCLGRAGLQPHLVSAAGDIAARSRWARGRTHHFEDASYADQLDELRRIPGVERLVRIPCTDLWAQAVADVAGDSRAFFATSAPTSAVVEQLVDKLHFAQALERFGVPSPRTFAVDSEADLDRELDGYFLKPRQSQLFAQRYHKKAIVVDSSASARAGFRMISEVGLTAVLQEYIPGPPDQHFFIDGFRDRDGRIAALFARRRLRMFPLDFGNSTLMESVALDNVAEAATGLERLLTGIGYRGIFSAEFKRDHRDGDFKLLEVNSRPWWYIEFASICGADVSVLAYRDALELPLPEQGPYVVGKRCVFLPQDIQAFRTLHRQGDLSLSAWIRSWRGAVPTVFSWSDPLPALSVPLYLLRRRVRIARAA